MGGLLRSGSRCLRIEGTLNRLNQLIVVERSMFHLIDELVECYLISPIDPFKHIVDWCGTHEYFPSRSIIDEQLAIMPTDEVAKIKTNEIYRLRIQGNNEKETDRKARACLLARNLYEHINSIRLELLISNNDTNRPVPYDHPAIQDLEIIEGMVSLANFEVDDSKFTRNG